MGRLYLSHRLDLLAKALSEALVSDHQAPLFPRTILVPHGALKQWLLLQLSSCSTGKGIAGYKILTLEEAFPDLFPESTELFFTIYNELSYSQDPELLTYLKSNSKRLVELSEHLVTLFLRCRQYSEAFLDLDRPAFPWQTALFRRLFLEKNHSLPTDILSKKECVHLGAIHCFGFDFLPSLFWEFLYRLNSVSIYLFSPCLHYWDDLCTNFERKGWKRYWSKKGVPESLGQEWENYWLNAPPLLANWGRVGRETIKILDRFDLEMKEDYSPYPQQKDSLLKRIQTDLLEFSQEKYKEPHLIEDSSIQIFLSGSSRLQEIEKLRESILTCMQHSDFSFSDISVFAPDIASYVPIIEFVFKDVPFKIFGVSLESKSFFLQGLHRLFSLVEENWEVEDLLTLFETPSFFKKQKWNDERIELFRGWLSQIPTTEKGINQLVSRFLYLSPEKNKTIEMSDADSLETFIQTILSLQEDLLVFREKKLCLSVWADTLQKLAEKYLFCELLDEADRSAFSFFNRFLQQLRQVKESLVDVEFIFAPIQKRLSQALQGQLNASHLNAVRFSSLSMGTIFPNKAIFLLGMDEESFPRLKTPSSLDLLKKEKVYIPDSSDEDRYVFLQVLLSSQEFLGISYRHLSGDDGKPIGPSFLVQELLLSLNSLVKQTVVLPFISSSTSNCLGSVAAHRAIDHQKIEWPDRYTEELPQGDFVIALSDLTLLSRHPWKFYLQKKLGIYLEEDQKDSFSFLKAKLLRSSLKISSVNVLEDEENGLPPGICGEALKLDLLQKINQRQKLLDLWDLRERPLFSLNLRESCREKKWVSEEILEMPALQFSLTENLRVTLVGEVKTLSMKGSIHLGDDSLSGILKSWPEYLLSCISLSTDQVFCFKSGKIKKIETAEDQLKSFLIYYFHALSAPSPLIHLWADSLLLKGAEALEKKIINSYSGKGVRFEDPVFQWVASRVSLPSSGKIVENWSPLLKKSFSGIISLYPGRGIKHA